MSIERIDKILARFEGKSKEELIEYYKEVVSKHVFDGKSINAKKIDLVMHLSKYIDSSDFDNLIEKSMTIKVDQMRAFILEHYNDEYSKDKKHFASISKWMNAAIEEIKITFNPPLINEQEAKEFHSKLCDEIVLIFCSYKKFNSGGNQLLIDLKAYFEAFPNFINKSVILEKIENNFEPEKLFQRTEIESLYDKIKNENGETEEENEREEVKTN